MVTAQPGEPRPGSETTQAPIPSDNGTELPKTQFYWTPLAGGTLAIRKERIYIQNF